MRNELFFAVLGLAAVGCEDVAKPDATQARVEEFFAFVQDGRTTREEALLKFGVPARQFEGGRILTWRLRVDPPGTVGPLGSSAAATDPRYATWPPGTHGYDLVLVFDAQGRVERHSKVEVR